MNKMRTNNETLDNSAPRRLTTLVAIDVCDYSKLSEKDEVAAIKAVDAAYALCFDLSRQHKGRVFNRIADGFLSEFPSTRDAIVFAIEYKSKISKSTFFGKIDIRIGIHVGDVVDRPNGDLLGHGVNVAVRLQESADRNAILVSSNVVNLLRDNEDFRTQFWKKLTLKNIEKPVRSYIVLEEQNQFFSRLNWIKNSLTYNWSVALLSAIGLLFTVLYFRNYQDSLDKVLTLNNIAPQVFTDNGASDSISLPTVSPAYVRNIIRTLRDSDVPGGRAVYALLENGNLNMAIESLEDILDDLPANSPSIIDTLHQMAALTYYRNPQDSLHYYESILAIDKNNKSALLWKFRVLNLLSRPKQAQLVYLDIRDRLNLSKNERLIIAINYAYSFSNQRDFESAIRILQEIEEEVESFGDRRLLAYWQVEMALAHQQLGFLDEAEAFVVVAIQSLEFLGADTNLSRAYSLRALISEDRSKLNPERTRYYLDEAYADYQREYKIAKKINKINDMVEGTYSMAKIDIDLGRIDLAEKNYVKSLRLARQSEHHLLQVYSLIGLAEVQILQKDQSQACAYKDEINKLYLKHPQSKILMGDQTKARLGLIVCDK